MPDIFDEVNEEMRAERARALAVRYGVMGGVLLLLVLAGVGAWQGWQWWQGRQSAAAAGPYLVAGEAADAVPPGPNPAHATAADDFASVAKNAPPGYHALAVLREASLRWDAGDKAAALSEWDGLSHDGSAEVVLRDLGALLWAQHSVDDGDPAAIKARTAALEQPANPWRPLAEEVDALVAVRLNDVGQARQLLTTLAADPAAAQGLRGRANGLLTLLGGGEAGG